MDALRLLVGLVSAGGFCLLGAMFLLTGPHTDAVPRWAWRAWGGTAMLTGVFMALGVVGLLNWMG